MTPVVGLGGCSRPADLAPLSGGWIGAAVERGHLLRGGTPARQAAAPVARRTSVLIVGAGVAGLACARALQQRGIDDLRLLELEDTAGGNSRGHRIGEIACPLGAHYLPVPGDEAVELIELLAGFGLCSIEYGRRVWDERHLCHSPQERLFVADAAAPFGGHWVDGLLPPPELLPAGERDLLRTEQSRFATQIARQMRSGRFVIPAVRGGFDDEARSLDAISFATWLDREGFRSAALRWYLDYCCRDDCGAGIGRVSAWAGLHYFASRHGFAAADDADADDPGILTWPEGNGWLTSRMAAPFSDRLLGGRSVLRIDEGRHAVAVDAWDHAAQRLERWSATQVVLATPLFIAARLLANPPPALPQAAARIEQAPWLVANLQIDEALHDRPGAAPSWDNVIYRGRTLGYVDAMHQSARPHPGPTVLTAYWPLGGDDAGDAAAARRRLLDQPWQAWADGVLDDLATAHPDLRSKLRRIELMRHGHAMAIPTPGTRSDPALAALSRGRGRVAFAHADLSGYSIFEEAFFHGHRVGGSLKL
ncbi:FAD-dependent oxidoreductase [Piscinibacter sakaiensis]|uniref:FAD-dependent oxidoreductase n=1 Tax=Piscinibacter sakaiensis TaxID=1547922 RepID=UPI003AAF1792